MEINRHIFFDKRKAPELLAYLQQHNIPHEDSFAVIFDILESSPYWPEVFRIVQSKRLTALSETYFSKTELNAAEWLCIRSKWHNGYPQPEDDFGYCSITYTKECYCPECGCGFHQIAPFRLKSQPKWGRRHFMSLNWVPDELFIDDAARRILEGAQHTGFHFSEVNNKNGTIVYPNVHQICVESVTRPGFVEGRDDLHEVLVCPECGIKRFHPNGRGMHRFHRKAFENMPDICKSVEYFGWGKASDRLVFINQRMYQTIVTNKLDRSLEFSPVELV